MKIISQMGVDTPSLQISLHPQMGGLTFWFNAKYLRCWGCILCPYYMMIGSYEEKKLKDTTLSTFYVVNTTDLWYLSDIFIYMCEPLLQYLSHMASRTISDLSVRTTSYKDYLSQEPTGEAWAVHIAAQCY